MNVTVYTDGSSNSIRLCGNRRGGWAAVFVEDDNPDKKAMHICGGEEDTTNNRMEMTAALEALKFADLYDNMTIYSDSQYVVKGFNSWIHGWLKNNFKDGTIKNQDLWGKFIPYLAMDNITIKWIKGHSKNRWNDEADKLARRAR